MTTRVILDTDIGTDVDDCLALAFLLASPEISLDAVTCVHGDVDLRARMAIELLGLRGRDEVPVYRGASRPLLDRRPIYWAGHEGQGLLEGLRHRRSPASEHAVDHLVRHVMSHPGQIHLLAIGPLTNVALALLREPALAGALQHLTIMGGALRGVDLLDSGYAEHNIRCDPEAADVVLRSGAPISLVPLDVTLRAQVRRVDLAAIRTSGDPFHLTIADQIERYPQFARTGGTFLHDPLAAATLIDRALLTWQNLHVAVETSGEHAAGVTFMRAPAEGYPPRAAVALGIDPSRAECAIVTRLAA
ncbi:MAG: nucleoside hydrolase [Chloroflexi bacterium]|nr:nucleoside hydrolase [Chloroflexota bacterium]